MICLTFDTDHMNEVRMKEFLNRIEIPGMATFFCTQKYPCLEATPHEVGPHPMLESGKDWRPELERMRTMFPEAQGWRSHSCVFSHILAEQLRELGYRYVSTHDDFGCARPRPHRHCWGVWHMPIYYMDNLDFSRLHFWPDEGQAIFAPDLIDRAVDNEGIYVFDFHPVHLLLNSNSTGWYFQHRDRFRAGEEIDKLSNTSFGVRSFFEQLCARMTDARVESWTMNDALTQFIS